MSQTEALLALSVNSSEQLRSVSVMEFRVSDLNIGIMMCLVTYDVPPLVRVGGGVSQGDVIQADVITRTDAEKILQKQFDIRPRLKFIEIIYPMILILVNIRGVAIVTG